MSRIKVLKQRQESGDNHKRSSDTKSKSKQGHRRGGKDERLCTFFAYLTFAKAVCTIRKIPRSMLIRDFKEYLVLSCGVPLSIQRLHYLDACELSDTDELGSLNIVDNASFRLGVWNDYEKLMRCVHENDFKKLLTCGIDIPMKKRVIIKLNDNEINYNDSDGENYRNSDTNNDGNDNIIKNTGGTGLDESLNSADDISESSSANNSAKHERTMSYCRKRAETALFAASQLGQIDIIRNLLEMGVDINSQTGLGYTPLHASVASGRYETIDYLLKNGAYCDTKSNQAKKAMDIAKLNGFDESERHLRSFEWQIRAKKVTTSADVPLLMHQQFDSKIEPVLSGEYSTKYVCSTLPKTEFSGTGIGSPQATMRTPDNRKKYTKLPSIHVPRQDSRNSSGSKVTIKETIREGACFEEWLKRKERQKLYEKQDQMEEEQFRMQQKQEKDRHRKTRQLNFYEEQQRRKNRITDEQSEKHSKINLYEEHKYLPNYQSSLIHQYMNELLLEHE